MLLFFLSVLSLSDDPIETRLFTNNDYGSKYYRIPAIVTANDGSLVTACDKRWNNLGDLPNKIDVVIRRSIDNGLTWQEPVTISSPGHPKGYGDPALVVDRTTGTIICIFNGENGFLASTSTNPQRIFICKSKDNGQTWSQKVDITNQLYAINCTNPERRNWQGLFVTAGAAVQLRSGRILAVVNVRGAKNSNDAGVNNYAIFSDDGGDTWDVSINSPGLDAAEAKIAERNNGDLLMSTRHTKNRWFSISKTKGLTWEPYYVSQEIIEPGCNGDLVLYTSTKDGYDKNRLVHSIPFNQAARKNISILISYDEGETWPVKKPIYAGNADYSSVSFLPDGRFAVYIEKKNDLGGFDMIVTTFTLDWLTDGEDTYTPPKKKRQIK